MKVPHRLISTSANLGNDREFIIKEYYLPWYEAFWGNQSKGTRVYAQSGQFHIIVESHVHLTAPILFALFFPFFNLKLDYASGTCMLMNGLDLEGFCVRIWSTSRTWQPTSILDT